MGAVDIARTHLPAISDATLPNTVAVVVVARRTPCPSFFNRRIGSTDDPLPRCLAPSVSERPGISEEWLYKVTSVLTANFCSAMRSAGARQE